MIVTVSANSVSVTMTEIPAPAFAIPGVGMSVVDSQASKLNITGPSAASTMATVPAQTNTAQTNTAAISGPSGVFIGVVGIVGMNFSKSHPINKRLSLTFALSWVVSSRCGSNCCFT